MITSLPCRNQLLMAVVSLFLAFAPGIANAQNADAAKKVAAELQAEQNPKKKMGIYLQLLDAISDYDSVQTERYAKEAHQLALTLKDKKSDAEVYRQQGLMYKEFSNFPKALQLLNSALQLAQAVNDGILVGDIYNNISNVYVDTKNNQLADVYIDKALRAYQAENSEADIAMIYANMGSNNSRRGDYPKAIEYLLKSLAIRERLHNDKGIGSVAFNITLPYKFLKRYDEALKYNQLAIEKFTLLKNEGQLATAFAVRGSILRSLKKYDEAISYINKALPLFEKYKNNAGIRNANDNIGLLYAEKMDFTNALKHFQISKQVSVRLNDSYGIVSANVNIAQTALDKNDLPTMAAALDEAEPLAKKYDFKEDRAELYKLRMLYAIATSNQKAANQTFDQYLGLRDSLASTDVNKSISEMQTRYETEKKDAQIKLNLLQLNNQELSIQQKQSRLDKQDQALLINQLELKNQHQQIANQVLDNRQKAQSITYLKKQSRVQELELANQKLKIRQRNSVIAAIIILILAAVVLAYAYYRRYKLRQEARLQAEIYKQQEIETRSLFEGEQKERIRIARDLHDSIGQLLSVVKMNLSNLGSQHQEDPNLMHTIGLVDQTITEVRHISHNLIPEELNFGLFSALEDLAAKVSKAGSTQVVLDVPDEVRAHQFEKSNELSIYRIVQEALSNIVKHAQASVIELTVTQRPNVIIIAIKDNGSGFDIEQIKNSKGIGWKNIAARVNLLDGNLQVRSEKLTGTQIEITIPG